MNRTYALLLVVLVAACSPAASAPSPSVAPIASAAPVASVAPVASPAPAIFLSVPEPLRGTWTAGVYDTTASVGEWTLIIAESDVRLKNPIGTDSFSIDPTAVTETELSVKASSDCPDQAVLTPGSYAVSLEGDSLEFTLNSDSCGDRAAILTAGPWTRTP